MRGQGVKAERHSVAVCDVDWHVLVKVLRLRTGRTVVWVGMRPGINRVLEVHLMHRMAWVLNEYCTLQANKHI